MEVGGVGDLPSAGSGTHDGIRTPDVGVFRRGGPGWDGTGDVSRLWLEEVTDL